MRTKLFHGVLLLVAIAGGGCVAPVQSGGSSEPTKPTSTAMTVGECNNLGCTTVQADTCPPILHDYGVRHWACKCAGGSSCITENSAQ